MSNSNHVDQRNWKIDEETFSNVTSSNHMDKKLYRFCFLFRAYITFSSFGLVQEGGTLVKFDGQSGRRRNPIRCNPEGTLGPWSKEVHSQLLSAPVGHTLSSCLSPCSLPLIFRFILTIFEPLSCPLRHTLLYCMKETPDIYVCCYMNLRDFKASNGQQMFSLPFLHIFIF